MTEETLEALMVKVVDGVATTAEHDTLMAHLADHPELAEELKMHQSQKAITDGWVQRLELDLLEDRHRKRSLPRIWNGLGITLVLLGFGVLLGGGMVELMLDPEAPWFLKGGLGGLGAGFFLLLVSVVWRRLTTRTHDPYTEVIR